LTVTASGTSSEIGQMSIVPPARSIRVGAEVAIVRAFTASPSDGF
jgi:hypothetical protein